MPPTANTANTANTADTADTVNTTVVLLVCGSSNVSVGPDVTTGQPMYIAVLDLSSDVPAGTRAPHGQSDWTAGNGMM